MKKSLFLVIVFCVVLGVVGTFILMPIFPQAQEESGDSEPRLIQPGSWIKYHIKRSEMDGAGFKEVWTSDLKVSVISENIKKGPHYYTVELIANGNTQDARVIQLRIDPDGIPMKDIITVKLPDLNPVEMDLDLWAQKTGISKEEIFRELVGNLLIVPFIKPKTKSESDKILVNVNGEEQMFYCERFLTESSKNKSATKLWYTNENIPFPNVAKILIFEESFHTQIFPIDYDTQGAYSVIKERAQKLEFREKK